ncbi:MAG: AbrB/MazE/SpoVT family DNA-binding domain-containing protein [Bacteroidota bacterium]
MTTRKTDERNIRSLTKISGGSSYAVTIPIEYIRKLKWKNKQKLDVRLYQERIIIQDWKPGKQ